MRGAELKARSATASGASRACVCCALTASRGVIELGKAKRSAGPARERQGREIVREGQCRVLVGGTGRKHGGCLFG